MQFAKWGIRELVIYSLLMLGMAALSHLLFVEWLYFLPLWWLGHGLSFVFFCGALWVFWFFRDPDRQLTGGDLDIVAPCDGLVTDAGVDCATGDQYIVGKCHVIGVFLSVFDVHVNKCSLDGEAEFLRYIQGQFLDARHGQCGQLNERQIAGFKATKAPGVRFELRQIAGAIARRIVCPLTPGQRLARGERYGMIKFGSRTELWLDAATCDVEWLVNPGDKVKGGETLIGRLKPKG